MTHLRKMMLEELERRNYSAGTTRRYLRFVERFANTSTVAGQARSDDSKLPGLPAQELKLCPRSVENHVAALRFFFVRTLRHYSASSCPILRVPGSCPTSSAWKKSHVRSTPAAVVFAHLLLVLYGTGMRRAELARVKIAHISNAHDHPCRRWQGTQGPRSAPSSTLLKNLRVYWRWLKPRDYLFPSASIAITSNPSATRPYGWRALKPRRRPAFGREFRRTSFDTPPSPRTCSKPVPTCAPFSFCSVMRIWR